MAEGREVNPDSERRDVATQIRGFFRVMVQQLWVVLLCMAVAGGAAYYRADRQEPVYESTARLLLEREAYPSPFLTPGTQSADPTRQAATDAQLVAMPKVAAGVRERLRSREPSGALLSKVRVASGGDSNVISITARDAFPRRAARIANAFAR